MRIVRCHSEEKLNPNTALVTDLKMILHILSMSNIQVESSLFNTLRHHRNGQKNKWITCLRQDQAEERVVFHAELVAASVYFCSLPYSHSCQKSVPFNSFGYIFCNNAENQAITMYVRNPAKPMITNKSARTSASAPPTTLPL